MMRRHWLCVVLVLVLSACSSSSRPFAFKNLAKSDMDLITDIHIVEIRDLIQTLTIKLYKRNPRELTKVPGATVNARLASFMTVKRPINGYAELGNIDGVDALYLAFAEEFEGDRVFALMVGITGMVSSSYNNQLEFYLLDDIDQQKLYNSARNLETVAWLLNTRTDSNGNLMLWSNGLTEEGVPNYSYERVLGQMMVIQDMMAKMVADSTNRHINQVVHGFASMTFFPI
ncbi:hypothetical protein A1OO_10280 [Enterovibrio norvegicus FF-33]|uniref:Lipoprotein n=1 Tax=Enterovibrio norvegicus FF-454 TaxID=1185651 RepID=A0A1E5C8F5_9GAMM|nr:hypothetical protein [Enterovibrio norvegicus]OEE61472.1 hypothetical protein A1OK_08940 [Enterovibrio norvegicus FF-454]OEE66171.1 hypothetical protein A1OO_10280 [Enterovibrio norvegicus FF-33]OEE74235.1 hypothetical protein A1OQ_01225 [Enterovibrio norvegicus FF-162]